jgi:hypothetical protein
VHVTFIFFYINKLWAQLALLLTLQQTPSHKQLKHGNVLHAVKQHVLQGDLDITHVISFAVMQVTLLPTWMGGWDDVIGAVETNSSYPIYTQYLNCRS